jgi:hypothetical protein
MTHRSYLWLIGSIVCGATCYGGDQQIEVSIKQNYGAPILEYTIPSPHYSFTDPTNITKKLSSIAIQQDIDKNGKHIDMVTIVLGTYGIFHRPFQYAIGSYDFPYGQEPKDTLKAEFSSSNSLVLPKFKSIVKKPRLKSFDFDSTATEICMIRLALIEYAKKNACILKQGNTVLHQPAKWNYLTYWFNQKRNHILYGLSGVVGFAACALIVTAWSLSRSKTFLNFNIHNARLS